MPCQASADAFGLSAPGQHIDVWGTLDSRCDENHERTVLMDHVMFARLWRPGPPTTLRSWLPPDQELCAPRFFTLSTMFRALGVSDAEASDMKLSMKIPGVRNIQPAYNMLTWSYASIRLEGAMVRNDALRCPAMENVVLVGSEDGLRRCEADGWQGCIRRLGHSDEAWFGSGNVAAAGARSSIPAHNDHPSQEVDSALGEGDDAPHQAAGPSEDESGGAHDAGSRSAETAEDNDDGGSRVDTSERQQGAGGPSKADVQATETYLENCETLPTDEEEDDLLGHLLEESDMSIKRSEEDILWRRACTFYRCSVDCARNGEGVKLLGFELALRAYQAFDIYHMLEIASSAEHSGAFNASTPGMGKTLETLAMAHIIALAFKSMDSYTADKTAHKHKDGSSGCALDHPLGIECYCVNGFTKRLCGRVPRQPQLIVVPPNLVGQWAAQFFKASQEVFQSEGGDDDDLQHLLSLYQVDGLTSISQFVSPETTRPARAKDFMPAVTIPGVLPAKNTVAFRNLVKTKDQKIGVSLADICNSPDTKATIGEPQGRRAERKVIICASSLVQRGSLADLFTATMDVPQKGRTTPLRLSIRLALRPGVVYYDEWHQAKGVGTNTVKFFRELCNVHAAAVCLRRPMTILLSGTPLTTGPANYIGVFPLVVRRDATSAIKKLEGAQKKYMEFERASKRGDKDAGDKQVLFREALKDVISPVFVYRSYTCPLLGLAIPDPRPPVNYIKAEFPAVESQHEADVNHFEEALQVYISKLKGEGSGAGKLQKLKNSMMFRLLLQMNLVPSLAKLIRRRMQAEDGPGSSDDNDDDGAKAEKPGEADLKRYARKNELACPQLRRVRDIVRSMAGTEQGGRTRHGLVVSNFPLVSNAAFAYLSSSLGVEAHVVNITASNSSPTSRRHLVEKAEIEAAKGDVPVIIVSTYSLMGEGIDGLQRFMDVVVMLGEPWTHTSKEQLVGRVHRVGQTRTVDVYEVHGGPGSLEQAIYFRNGNREVALDSNHYLGILKDM